MFNAIIVFFANIFGYILKFLLSICGNFGVAIILFSLVTKIILLPMLIKQQRSTKQMTKLQPKLKELQDKYKDNREKYAAEYTKLQKEENFSPFAGCLIAILQIPIILGMFYIVSKPLTYMEKISKEQIEVYKQELNIQDKTGRFYPEIEIIKQKPELGINLNFFGVNLGDVPVQNKTNYSLLIIPVLSVIVTLLSVKITSDMQNKMNENNEKALETQKQMKAMNYFLPIMSGYIAYQVPLGLGIYWLVSNILQIAQQKLVYWYIDKKENVEKKDVIEGKLEE